MQAEEVNSTGPAGGSSGKSAELSGATRRGLLGLLATAPLIGTAVAAAAAVPEERPWLERLEALLAEKRKPPKTYSRDDPGSLVAWAWLAVERECGDAFGGAA